MISVHSHPLQVSSTRSYLLVLAHVPGAYDSQGNGISIGGTEGRRCRHVCGTMQELKGMAALETP